MKPMRIFPLIIVLALALAMFASCSDDDDPTAPQPGSPYHLVAPLENAVVDVPLTANQPTTVNFTLQLPPDIPVVTAAEIDIVGTLDHVSVDGLPLWKLIARKVAALVHKADDIGATATIRVGDDPATVCDSDEYYGPFTISHVNSLVVEPEFVAADETTLEIINYGTMVVCMTIVPNIDALLSVDAVAMDITEGNCDTPADFDGIWSGTFECGDNCSGTIDGNIQLTVTQTGTEATYTDDGGDTFEGVVCGNMFRFEYVGEGFAERGTLTLDSANTATKRSTWRSTIAPYCGGDCVDYLTREVGSE